MSDWSREEYLGFLNLRVQEKPKDVEYVTPTDLKKRTKTENLISWTLGEDWVAWGYVNPIKNQGNCGSCWSYTAVGALESFDKIENGNTLTEYSEQYLVDCDYDENCPSGTNTGNCGCDGGDPANGINFAAENGIPKLSVYPLSSDQTRGNCIMTRARSTINSGTRWLTTKSASALKTAVN